MKDEGVCTKVAFPIQNQRFETKQSHYRVYIETCGRPIDW